MLSRLRKITINNYINSNCTLSTDIKIFPNILFLKQLNDKNLTTIITDPKNYVHIKNIIFRVFPDISNDIRIHNAFIELEEKGFCSFMPFKKLDKTIQDLLNKKYKFLLENKYYCPYLKICSNIESPLFNKSSNQSVLHLGIFKFLQLINNDMFVPYTIFNSDSYTDLILYHTNNHIKNILIASKNNKAVLPRNQILLLCNLSITLINSLGEFLNKNTNNLTIDLFLYMSLAKKICPDTKYDPISYEHVNSGSTTYYLDSTYADPLVKIYRTEELIKVLFHELIHACKFEQLFDDYPEHTFKVSRKHLLFTETITECFARIMNIILYSHIYGKKINIILNDEIQFGLVQTAKILNHYGFQSVKDFLNLVPDERIITQETSVFEYYILTPILLIKFNDFVSLIQNKGTIKDVVTLINTTFNDYNYQKKVDYIIKKINNIDDIIMNTCKMTVIKMDLLNIVNYNKCKQQYLNSKQCKLV